MVHGEITFFFHRRSMVKKSQPSVSWSASRRLGTAIMRAKPKSAILGVSFFFKAGQHRRFIIWDN